MASTRHHIPTDSDRHMAPVVASASNSISRDVATAPTAPTAPPTSTIAITGGNIPLQMTGDRKDGQDDSVESAETGNEENGSDEEGEGDERHSDVDGEREEDEEDEDDPDGSEVSGDEHEDEEEEGTRDIEPQDEIFRAIAGMNLPWKSQSLGGGSSTEPGTAFASMAPSPLHPVVLSPADLPPYPPGAPGGGMMAATQPLAGGGMMVHGLPSSLASMLPFSSTTSNAMPTAAMVAVAAPPTTPAVAPSAASAAQPAVAGPAAVSAPAAQTTSGGFTFASSNATPPNPRSDALLFNTTASSDMNGAGAGLGSASVGSGAGTGSVGTGGAGTSSSLFSF